MGSMSVSQCTTIAFDVGNSTVKCAVLRREQWQVAAREPTEPVEALACRLRRAMAAQQLLFGPESRCLVSSVCPPADEQIMGLSRALPGAPKPEFFGRDIPIPMETLLRHPERAGTDRLLCALGARAIAGAPCIVVGLGTAITVDHVDAEGRFTGGAIAPGLGLAAHALHEGTACLPEVTPLRPRQATGHGTEEAIQSGIYWLCRGGVAEIARQLRMEQGSEEAPVVVTGGDAELLLPLPVSGPVHHEPNLIFVGMATALGLRADA